jgi:hypothetical protein
MQKINRTTSAPLAAGFIILSLAIMPFSLRVVGFTLSLNPSLSAVVDVWNQIAGNFGGGHQSATPAELLAISNLDSNEASEAAAQPAVGSPLLARLEQPEPVEMYQPQFSAIEVEDLDAGRSQARGLKAPARSAQSVKRAGTASYYTEVRARIEQHAEELKAAEVAQRQLTAHAERLTGLDTQLAAMKFDFHRMLKTLPLNKDVKFFVRTKPVKPVAFKLTACDLRRALTGVRAPEARQAETRVRVVESSAISFETSEL